METANASVGNLAVVIGAHMDASPTVRLAVVHRFLHTTEGTAPVLDLIGSVTDPGSLVLSADGRLVGIAALGPTGEIVAIPGVAIDRMLLSATSPREFSAHPSLRVQRRGWLGVALQPINLPRALVTRAGQASGRMVVDVTKGGPADIAGLRMGDVLLALSGTSASGPHALRAFLEVEQIGSTVSVTFLRDGSLLSTHLTITAQLD